MQIQDLSFQQELTLDETDIQGGILDPVSFKSILQGQFTGQGIAAGAGGGLGGVTIGSPSVAVGFQIPTENAFSI